MLALPVVIPEAWRRDAMEVAAELSTDVRMGLTSAEAAARLERYGPNHLDAAAMVTAWRKLLFQFADPLIYLPGFDCGSELTPSSPYVDRHLPALAVRVRDRKGLTGGRRELAGRSRDPPVR